MRLVSQALSASEQTKQSTLLLSNRQDVEMAITSLRSCVFRKAARVGEDRRLWLQNPQNEVRFAMAAFINPRRKTISTEGWGVWARTSTQEHQGEQTVHYSTELVQSMSIAK
jgi:hypothetical protein